MTTYARLTTAGAFERLVELTAEQYAALQANGKASLLRLWAVDALPVPTSSQVVVQGPIAITAEEARQTWQVREKTTAELEVASLITERSKIEEILADIATQRAVTREQWDALTAIQLRAEQWRDRQVLLRLASLVGRRIRQEIA